MRHPVTSFAVLLCSVLSAGATQSLTDFETAEQLAAWQADKGITIERVTEHAVSGSYTAMVSFPAGSNGVWTEPTKPMNWLNQDRLSLDLYNGSLERVTLVMRIEDARGKKLERRHSVPAIVAMRTELILNQQHWLDLAQVKRIWIGVEGLKAPARIYLDNVRLVSVRSTHSLGAGGGVIQAEDFTRGNCMINPTGWGKRHNDTPIIQGGGHGIAWAEWDLELTKPGRYQLDIKHAAEQPRPCRVSIDGDMLHREALSETTGSWEGFTAKWFTVARIGLAAGKHTLRIDRSAATPHIDAIRLVPSAGPLLCPAFEAELGRISTQVGRLRTVVAGTPETANGRTQLVSQLNRLAAALTAMRSGVGQTETRDSMRRRVQQVMRAGVRLLTAVQGNCSPDAVHYTIAVETSLTKVFPEQSKLCALPKPNVEIRLAANEYECAQLVVVPLADIALKSVRVTVSDLVCEHTGARIGAANVRLHRVGFVEADSGGTTSQPGERWPDPLLPNAAFDVPVGEVRPVWITAYAPKGTASGVYKGELTVAPEGERSTRLQLLLKVYGFELDDETHVKTTFYLPIPWANMSDQDVHRWMDYVMSYRIGIMDIGWGFTSRRSSRIDNRADGSYDFSRIDKDLDYVLSRHMNSVSLGDTPFSVADNSDAEKQEMVRLLRAYAQHIKGRGWWDRCYYKLPDEPGGHADRLAKVKVVADLVKQADPEYPRLCTMKVREDFFGYVDIWCPLLSWHDDEIYAKARARGDKIWMYTCCGPRPPWANIAFIDQEAIAHRILMWTCWRFGYGGYLYWGVKFWPKQNFGKDGKPLWPDKPWHSRIRHLPAGDGYMAYPDRDGDPLPCIRIELFRDGVEDYEYHYLLKQALAGRRDAEAERLLNLTYDDAVCPDGQHYTRDPEVLLRRRDALAAAIERLATP